MIPPWVLIDVHLKHIKMFIADLVQTGMTSVHIKVLNELLDSATAHEIGPYSVVLAEATLDSFMGDFAYLAQKFMEMESCNVLFALANMEEKVQVVARSRVDAVDVANAAWAGTTSQVSMSALIAATDDTDRATGLSLQAASDLEPYFEAVRVLYGEFESGLPGPTGRVYHHEIPGGQLSNLRQQAIALGLGDRFEAIEDMYAAANAMLGNIVKVTPSSKVVGDLALALVGQGVDPAAFADDPQRYDIPDSVIGFLNGDLGQPPGGWPEPFRTKALAGRRTRPVETELSDADAEALASDPRRTLNRLLFPGPTKDFEEATEKYSDLSVLTTRQFLHGLEPGIEHQVPIERGKTLLMSLQAIGEADERGLRPVMATVNGQVRQVLVRDLGVQSSVVAAERANPDDPGQVPAPFSGVVTLTVAAGDTVAVGDQVATIEAMKMEASITSPVAGTVQRVALQQSQTVEGGDLLLVVTPS